MANTHSNLTGTIRHIHEAYPVSEVTEGVSVVLSSREGHIAQLDLADVQIRRRFGRRVMSLEVIDQSGLAEFEDRQSSVHLRVKLGHAAIIGRDRLPLPLLRSELTLSEDHLAVSYSRRDGVDMLELHDNSSVNGSHILRANETTWQERTDELVSNEADAGEGHTDSAVNNDSFQWLYDRNVAHPKYKTTL